MKKIVSFMITLIVLAMAFGVTQCANSRTEEPVNIEKVTRSANIQVNKSLFPQAQREFRAAWVATVDNIDWPSEKGLTSEQQKAEVVAILDTAANLNFNAIIFQVRPQCDALYASDLEPWSYYLSGVQGQAPEPHYDPLQFWITEAHKRGIELHAWFNPYRAHHPKGGPISDSSIVRTHPELVKDLETGYFWMDPALKATREHSHNVVMDVVRRYDIDGVHFDDYFYPYGDGDFPDEESWAAYQATGGKMARKDWRRDAVNTFIRDLYQAIKAEKPSVKFGLSPFGIWRPGHPASIKGYDQYDKLYADARLWLNEGWVDYWTPQLYWAIKQVPQSFPVLLNWWTGENTHERHLWPGLYTGRFTPDGPDETLNQIMVSRGFAEAAPGQVHFSMKAFLQNRGGINQALKNGPYQQPALVPPTPWLDNTAPAAPVAELSYRDDSTQVSWQHPQPEDVFRWVLYVRRGKNWDYMIAAAQDRDFKLPMLLQLENRSAETDTIIFSEPISELILTAVDRMGNESAAATVPANRFNATP